MIRKRCSQKEIPTQKTELGKTGNYTCTKKTYGKPSEQLFPKRWPLSYSNLAKNEKTHIGANSTKIQHQIIKQLEPQQKYRHGMNSNIKLWGAELH